MPKSALQVFHDAGHQAYHVRGINLGDATDEQIDQYANQHGWVLVTRDLDFSDTRKYSPEGSAGRLILRVSDTSTAVEIDQLLKRFLMMPELVSQLPGHLAILDFNKVRFRPALSKA